MMLNDRYSVAGKACLAVLLAGGCGAGTPGDATRTAGDADDVVWVARQGKGLFGPDTLLAIDPRSAEIRRRVGTEDLWSNLAIGDGALWSAGSAADMVVRIDPRNGQADTVQLPEVGESMSMDNPLRLAAGDGAIWIITLFGRHGLHRVDPVNNTVAARLEDVGDGAVAIAYGEGSVWVASVHDGMVQRIDPGTLATLARIPVGGRPVSVAVGAGAIWVGRQRDGMVDRIDPQTNTVTASFPVGGEPGQIIVAHDAVWVLNHADQSMARIDPATSEVTAIVQLGGAPNALAAAS